MKQDKVLFDSDEAAKQIQGTGWVSRHGRFFGADERTARYDGCTHRKCNECGGECEKSYTSCRRCRDKKGLDKFAKLPRKPYDGETPLNLWDTEKYFFSWEDVEDYAYDHECTVSDLRLVFCKPQTLPEFYASDLLCDYLAEDQEPPGDVMAAVDALNAVLKKHGNFCWYPGNVAVDLSQEATDATR